MNSSNIYKYANKSQRKALSCNLKKEKLLREQNESI